MNTITAAAVLVAAALILVVAVVLAVRWWIWRPVVTRRVMVQTDADVSFSGVVVARRGPLLVLDDVSVYIGQTATKADGRVVIDRARVTWMQVG